MQSHYIIMLIKIIFGLILVLKLNCAANIINSYVNSNETFPDDFLFGVSTAAYQIEGGWNEDGKSPNIWDDLVHKHPELIADRSNADIGPNSYHFLDKDIKAIKELKMDFYRFSIAWSRILPYGDTSVVNKDGIDYYNRLINELLANNIQPMVTMFHLDLPQSLQDLGGMVNAIFINYFKEYANILFEHYGDRVKYWITFNEPADFCIEGYGTGSMAPLIKLSGVGEYYCADIIIKSHAEVYHLYKSKYSHQIGKIGMTCSSRFFYATDPNDKEIVDRALQYGLGWFTHPIFSKAGNYPPIMIEEIASNSAREGRLRSRLPEMTQKWKTYIKGSADFFALNYYTSRLVTFVTDVPPRYANNSSWKNDARLDLSVDPNWQQAKSKWIYMVPKGLGDLLKWIKNEYDNPELIITENGWSDNGELEDNGRINYLREHLREIIRAINEYGCNVKGYTVWSLMDNFEWLAGYTERFGLYSIDMNDENKERIPKKSASFMKIVAETKNIPNF